MIRMILFVVVGLLAGLGAGTGIAVLKAKSAFASESARRAKIVADSLEEHANADAKKGTGEKAVHAAPADSATPTEATAPTISEPVTAKPSAQATEVAHRASRKTAPTETVTPGAGQAEPNATAAAGGGERVPAASVPAPVHAPVTSAASKSEDGAQPKRISKIFAAMPPKDAAKVLTQMDDADVHLILGALGDKQAAAILQNFPAERAAAISKKAMRGSREP